LVAPRVEFSFVCVCSRWKIVLGVVAGEEERAEPHGLDVVGVFRDCGVGKGIAIT